MEAKNLSSDEDERSRGHNLEIRSSKGITQMVLDGKDISESCYSFCLSQDGTEGLYLSMVTKEKHLLIENLLVEAETLQIAE